MHFINKLILINNSQFLLIKHLKFHEHFWLLKKGQKVRICGFWVLKNPVVFQNCLLQLYVLLKKLLLMYKTWYLPYILAYKSRNFDLFCQIFFQFDLYAGHIFGPSKHVKIYYLGTIWLYRWLNMVFKNVNFG
jgi:hypothetical protein